MYGLRYKSLTPFDRQLPWFTCNLPVIYLRFTCNLPEGDWLQVLRFPSVRITESAPLWFNLKLNKPCDPQQQLIYLLRNVSDLHPDLVYSVIVLKQLSSKLLGCKALTWFVSCAILALSLQFPQALTQLRKMVFLAILVLLSVQTCNFFPTHLMFCWCGDISTILINFAKQYIKI